MTEVNHVCHVISILSIDKLCPINGIKCLVLCISCLRHLPVPVPILMSGAHIAHDARPVLGMLGWSLATWTRATQAPRCRITQPVPVADTRHHHNTQPIPSQWGREIFTALYKILKFI